jgi:hypothetical protein
METLAFVIRYGFLVALIVEAVLLGRAFFGMLREKAVAAPAGQTSAGGAASAEE